MPFNQQPQSSACARCASVCTYAAALLGLACTPAHAQPVFIETIGIPGSLAGQFDQPSALAFDSSGALYVADTGNDRIQKFNFVDGVYTYSATIGTTGSGDGQFQRVVSVAVDGVGNVYAGDAQRSDIQKFTPVGQLFSHDFTFSGGLSQPVDLVFDASGDLYVAEENANRVSVFTPQPGTLTLDTTFTASGAMQRPTGVDIGDDGTIYVVDAAKNLYTGFRLGNIVGLTDTEPLANAAEPTDIAVANDGSLFISGTNPNRVTKYGYANATITSQTIFAQTGAAFVNTPQDIIVDDFGNVIATATDNNVLRRWFDPGALAPGNTAVLADLTIGNLGSTLILSAGKSVQVLGTTIVEPGGLMRVFTDQFTTENLGVFGGEYEGPLAGVTSLTFLSGTLTVTDSEGLTIGDTSPAGATLDITALKTLGVDNDLIIDATGTLNLDGGAASARTLINNGTFNAGNTTLTLTDNTSTNNATINITAGGLRLTNDLTNSAQVNVTDSVIRVDTAFENSAAARIDTTGLSTLRLDGGLNNLGTVRFDAADAGVVGEFTNAAGASVELANASLVTFAGVVANDGAITVEAGSTAEFDSTYRGIGTIAGAGLSVFRGAVQPGGDVAASISIAGDVELEASATTTIQIGGTTAGTDFDRFVITGQATLGGTLSIELIDDYLPTNGEVFVILTAGSGIAFDPAPDPPPGPDEPVLPINPFDTVVGLTVVGNDAFELIYDDTLQQVRLIAPVVTAILPGDTDGDGDVDDADLGTSFSNYTGALAPGEGTRTDADGDTDGDGDVDDADLGTSFANYTGALAMSVPEPTAGLVLLVGIALRLKRRGPDAHLR